MGWVLSYALVDRTGERDLAELRSLQDWFLKLESQTVLGVAEVATGAGSGVMRRMPPRWSAAWSPQRC